MRALEILVMNTRQIDPDFWGGKKVFLTGHTGFKGGWLSLWLSSMGAEVTGFALAPNTEPNLYEALNVESFIKKSYIADIRDLTVLKKAISDAAPDILIHMAAQPLVRYSYMNPVETYETNIMGTVNVLEGVRTSESIRATLVITTDKCYENKEWLWGYRENEAMGGADPYSSSKGCAELISSAYRKSYFSNSARINFLATARAGNVIGGGDWSQDRLIPDAIKAFEAGNVLSIRNPFAIRPWQHVLEPLSGYIILTQALFQQGSNFASGWNFGPREDDARSVRDVVDLLASQWGKSASWLEDTLGHPHEAMLLKLDCSKARTQLGWKTRWNLEIATQKIVDWHKAYRAGKNMREITISQIQQYLKD